MLGEGNGEGRGKGKGQGEGGGGGGGEGKGKGKGKGKGGGGGENCCGNSNLDFHPKFLPPKIVFFILYISLNFTIRTSWTWRGLKTIH